jgi:hypothetical protein
MWLWARRVTIDCLGTPSFGLPVEEELVYLATHAGKPYHGFNRMVWLADLVMLSSHAESSGGVDWARVEEISITTQSTTVVSAALQMATRMGLELPVGRFALPTQGWRAVSLERLLSAEWPVSDGVGTFHIRFALVDSPWRRLVLLGASPYRQSWSERLHAPTRALSRSLALWRASHRAPSSGLPT